MDFDFDFALSILPDLLRGAIVTMEEVLGGFLIALIGGLALVLIRRSRRNAIAAIAEGYIEFIRNTPLLVQLYFIFYALPLAGITFSAMATGILGLGLNYSAYTAEVYRGGIDGVPRGQWEAASALDLRPKDKWLRIILPQAIPPMVPVFGNYLIGMFKDTPLLATITIPEMFQAAKQIAGETYRYNEPYTLLALIFLAMSYPASLFFRFLEKHSHV